MTSSTARYSIGDLAGLVGSTPRTIRYYVAQGLLPPPEGAGAGAHYSNEHLDRLRLIQRLQHQHQPLSDIRQRLSQLGAREVAVLVADEEPEAPSDSALDYVRTVLAGPLTPVIPPPMSPPAPPPPAPRLAARRLAAPAFGLLQGRPAESPDVAAGSLPSVSLGDVPPTPHAAVADEAAAAAFVPPREAVAPPAAEAPGAAEPSPQTPEQRSQWDRIGLTPNIEIHVRRPLSRLENRRVERLITIARHMLQEEKP
jgi:DNA-binding transcriptional MerR regulator